MSEYSYATVDPRTAEINAEMSVEQIAGALRENLLNVIGEPTEPVVLNGANDTPDFSGGAAVAYRLPSVLLDGLTLPIRNVPDAKLREYPYVTEVNEKTATNTYVTRPLRLFSVGDGVLLSAAAAYDLQLLRIFLRGLPNTSIQLIANSGWRSLEDHVSMATATSPAYNPDAQHSTSHVFGNAVDVTSESIPHMREWGPLFGWRQEVYERYPGESVSNNHFTHYGAQILGTEILGDMYAATFPELGSVNAVDGAPVTSVPFSEDGIANSSSADTLQQIRKYVKYELNSAAGFIRGSRAISGPAQNTEGLLSYLALLSLDARLAQELDARRTAASDVPAAAESRNQAPVRGSWSGIRATGQGANKTVELPCNLYDFQRGVWGAESSGAYI